MNLFLASAGDDVKFWESTDFILSRQLNPHDQNVSTVCWANDNSFLASLSVHTEDVAITNMKNYEVSTIPCGTGCMCIDINEHSRYMLTGGTDALISVWDLKTKKVRKKYKGHKGPVTCASFNAGTSSIASGSESGEIILHNVVTAQACRPLVAPNIQAVKQVQFSRHKKSMLGSVSDDGSVNLWDCNAQRLVHGFSNHRAPATSLSFSPINDMFLISVGLDKRIACYDVQAKKAVKIMSADSPLTSLDTNCDGVTVVVGSTRGKIYHYDLRMGAVPVQTVDAHKSSVQCLRFQLEADLINSSKFSTPGVGKQTKHRQLPISPKSAANRDNGAMEMRPPVSGVSEDVFSPLREGFQSVDEVEHTSAGSFTNITVNNGNNSSDPYAGGVFSPLNDNNMGRGSSGLAMSPLALSGYGSAGNTSYGNNSAPMDYNRIQTKNYVPDIKVTNPSIEDGFLTNGDLVNGSAGSPGMRDQVRVSPGQRSGLSLQQETSQVHHGQKHVAFVQVDQDEVMYTGSTESSPDLMRSKSSSSQQDISMGASPLLPGSYSVQHTPAGSAVGENSLNLQGGSVTPDGVNPQAFVGNNTSDTQTVCRPSKQHNSHSPGAQWNDDLLGQIEQIVRNVVQEEVGKMKKDVKTIVKDEIEELMYQVHNDIINLQAQMLVQFEIQHTELLTLFQQYSVNYELVTEIERLQEEIKRLKNYF